MREGWRSLAPIPLRLILGFGFAFHGYPKLFTASGHQGFAGMLEGGGIPAPELMAWAVGALEFFGGILLIVGAFTVLVSALSAVEMAVAMVMVHLPHGFNFMNVTGQTETGVQTFGMPGYEVNLLYIAGFLALMLGGAGAASVDAMRRRTRGERRVPGRLPVEPTERDIPDGAWTGDRAETPETVGSDR
jgi:putative oxidoreductase